MSDDEVVKAGIKAALKAKRLRKKNGVILEGEYERAAIFAYKERLKEEVNLWKERNEKEMGIGYSEAMNRVLQLINETN